MGLIEWEVVLKFDVGLAPEHHHGFDRHEPDGIHVEEDGDDPRSENARPAENELEGGVLFGKWGGAHSKSKTRIPPSLPCVL